MNRQLPSLPERDIVAYRSREGAAAPSVFIAGKGGEGCSILYVLVLVTQYGHQLGTPDRKVGNDKFTHQI